MKRHFQKRIYTPGLLLRDLLFLIQSTPDYVSLIRNPLITRPFYEKIMTVVTAVNGCVYCTWFHAQQAAKSGLSNEEIQNLLRLQFQADASSFELSALLYAQHYAETNRQPAQEMTEKLFSEYGKKTAHHIVLVIRMIFFGNLHGNTFDAFLSRCRGVKAEKSSLCFELLLFLMNAPFLLPILLLAKRKERQQQ